MNHQFVFENGKGNVLTEDSQPMNIVADTGMMELEDLATMDTYTKQHGSVTWEQQNVKQGLRNTRNQSTPLQEQKQHTTKIEMVETRTYCKDSEDIRNLVIDYYVDKRLVQQQQREGITTWKEKLHKDGSRSSRNNKIEDLHLLKL